MPNEETMKRQSSIDLWLRVGKVMEDQETFHHMAQSNGFRNLRANMAQEIKNWENFGEFSVMGSAWLILSERLTSIWSIVMKKLSKLAMRKRKLEGSNPKYYYCEGKATKTCKSPLRMCFKHCLILLWAPDSLWYQYNPRCNIYWRKLS